MQPGKGYGYRSLARIIGQLRHEKENLMHQSLRMKADDAMKRTRGSMSRNVYKYDDNDDYGIPLLARPSDGRTRARIFLRRYRSLIIISSCLLALWLVRQYFRVPAKDWSRFAYVQYATDAHSMCNALMVFEALHRLGSKADRVLLFPREWNDVTKDPSDRNSELLYLARKSYRVNLRPVQLLGVDGPATPGTLRRPSGWKTSITKLRVFELEKYDRVLYFDNDVTVLQHMDELFLSPPAAVAMPRMYWDDPHKLTSLLMLIQPNAAETENMYDRLQEWRLQPGHTPLDEKYDMELMNERFGSSAMVLPHRPYALLTSEFRKKDHSAYLGTANGPPSLPKWDALAVLKEAKLVHFSDWPLPKPWIMWPTEGLTEIQPDCGGDRHGTCREREVWKNLYDDFRHRRKDVCRILSVPAPRNWAEYKNLTGAGPH